jgi:glycosyl-4,4'-diaponeurosporenoate acyltransferase
MTSLDFLLLNIGTWIFWIFLVGYSITKIPANKLDKDLFFTKLMSFEIKSDWYKKVILIDKWKDKLPEFGDFFGNGFAKRSVKQGEIEQLKQFIVATRRAELAHWIMTAGWLITITFNPLWAIIANIIFAHIINFPCLLVQRYNRIRLTKVLTSKLSRGGI